MTLHDLFKGESSSKEEIDIMMEVLQEQGCLTPENLRQMTLWFSIPFVFRGQIKHSTNELSYTEAEAAIGRFLAKEKIETYTVSAAMGIFREKLTFLSTEENNELDSIGYSGKTTKGRRISREDYLNSLDKGDFKVIRTSPDNGDFTEEFLIIHVK